MLIAAVAARSGVGLAARVLVPAVWRRTLAPTPAMQRRRSRRRCPRPKARSIKPRSPERADLVERGAGARLVELSGYVLTRGCRPVARALVDLWHADDGGDYDNRGFRYRGHVFTDEQGRYRFRTIVPATLSRPHPPLSRQGAGARPAAPDHAALFSGRAAQRPRRLLPSRAADARRGAGPRDGGALRFRHRHALSKAASALPPARSHRPDVQQPQKPFPVSWDQFHRDARALAWRLAEAGPFEAIVCITRGGLVPAAIVARELGIRVIETVCVASYNHTTQGELHAAQGHRGATSSRSAAGAARACWSSTIWSTPARPPSSCATFCRRRISPRSTPSRMGRPMVDTFITEVSQDTWIFFPWDTGLAFQPPIREGGL